MPVFAVMMSGDSFWKSGGTALLFAMPMTKPETESGRRMLREKPDIFIMPAHYSLR